MKLSIIFPEHRYIKKYTECALNCIQYEAPRAYARGILKFFGERNPPKHYPSTLLRQAQDSLRVSAISHSSTSLHSWFSAKADKPL